MALQPQMTPHLREATFGFIFCCHHLDILNHFGTRSPIFSFCTENYKSGITGIINTSTLETRRLGVKQVNWLL